MADLKVIQYFKTTRGRYGGKNKTIITVHALREDGTFKTVDTSRNTIRVNLTLGSQPISKVEKITQEEFEKAFNKVKNA